MEHKLSKLKQLKTISLTQDERAALRLRLAQAISAPALSHEPLFQHGMQHGLRIALSSFLFVIFVGGSISAVASNALPGDPLYEFKVNVNEEIKAAFLNSPEEKVAFAKNRVEKRVGEIRTLAATKTLTKEKQAKAQKALDANIKDLSTELSVLSEESPNSALTITATLEENLKADKEALQSAFGTEASAGATAAIDGTLEKVSKEEVKILSKEIDNLTDELEATSTESLNEQIDQEGAVQGTSTGLIAPTEPLPPSSHVTPVSP